MAFAGFIVGGDVGQGGPIDVETISISDAPPPEVRPAAPLSHPLVVAATGAAGITECSIGITQDPAEAGENCLSAVGVEAVRTLVPGNAGGTPAEVIARAKSAENCTTQSCLLRRATESGALTREQAAVEGLRLKAEGPATSLKLLGNDNIDGSLARFVHKWPGFLPLGFCMMNFAEHPDAPMCRFSPEDAARAGKDTVACVLNTDVYGGRGKHWVCVFVDMRGGAGAPWSVEYFNSSGRPPPAAVVTWQQDTRAKLVAIRAGTKNPGPVDIVRVNERAHQKKNTECGVYCVFYIFCRLHDTPYTAFQTNHTVPDDDMAAFRAYLFVEK